MLVHAMITYSMNSVMRLKALPLLSIPLQLFILSLSSTLPDPPTLPLSTQAATTPDSQHDNVVNAPSQTLIAPPNDMR